MHDALVWKNYTNGILKDKLGFLHYKQNANPVIRGKKIWHNLIPPFHSFISWRIIHYKHPTDKRG